MSINGHKTSIHEANVTKKKKIHKNLTYIPQKVYTLPLTKKYPMLTLPLNTRLLSSQNYFPFSSRMTKGKSLRGRHHIIIERVNILIITILIYRSLWRRRWKRSETTKATLSSCYTTNTGVHLTHLIGKRVKASIHALKLCHDGLQGHTNYRKRRSKGGRSYRIYMIGHLRSWPL